MTEREGTPEDFARLFGAESSEPEPTDEEVVQAEQEDPPAPAPTEDADGSQFLRRLFEPKRGHVEFIRSIHGDGSV